MYARLMRFLVKWFETENCVVNFKRSLILYILFFNACKISANAFSMFRGICFWAVLTNISQSVWNIFITIIIIIIIIIIYFFIEILVSQSINITIGKHRIIFFRMKCHALFTARFLLKFYQKVELLCFRDGHLFLPIPYLTMI